MFETAKLKATLITISVIACPASDPVTWYSRTSSAPRIPKIAPDAPTVTDSGLSSSAPAEPARPATT